MKHPNLKETIDGIEQAIEGLELMLKTEVYSAPMAERQMLAVILSDFKRLNRRVTYRLAKGS